MCRILNVRVTSWSFIHHSLLLEGYVDCKGGGLSRWYKWKIWLLDSILNCPYSSDAVQQIQIHIYCVNAPVELRYPLGTLATLPSDEKPANVGRWFASPDLHNLNASCCRHCTLHQWFEIKKHIFREILFCHIWLCNAIFAVSRGLSHLWLYQLL